ncbi:branched-chain amino acid ABC transporter permease [Nocardioides dongkuii]|uniref:branched-chain amino acid ABC transporter permease n=1 Tax=Nocardioides dongkuii TaxID=2760089 RepID=UPI0015FC2800|nr:branched-chain amino acid ABC transporter permease [Nocardioides dongkuii]
MPAQLWVSVIELGCFAGLLGLGYYLVLRGADIFLFILGSLGMFAAMFGSHLMSANGWPWPLAIGVGVLASVVIAVLTERLIVRPIHQRTNGEETPSIIAVVAILFALEQLAGTLFGRTPRAGHTLWDAEFTVAGARVTGQSVLLVGATLVAFVAVGWWMRNTASGRMLRAVGDNEHAAQMMGVPVERIRLTAFALAGLLGGIAGTLFAAKAGVAYTSGLQWTLVGFLAVIVGGLGRVWAPLVGALIVAALQTWTVYQFGHAVRDYTTLGLALVFFALRPEGIFQTKVRL